MSAETLIFDLSGRYLSMERRGRLGWRVATDMAAQIFCGQEDTTKSPNYIGRD